MGARSLQALSPLPGRSEEPGAVVPGTAGGCSYLNHNQEADGEEEEEEAFHLGRLSAALSVAAFGGELRAVCRPPWAWLLLKEGEAGRRGGGKGRRASGGVSTAAVLQTLGLRTPGPSSTALAGDGLWRGTGAHPRAWEVGKPRGSWGPVKRALGLEPCRAGIESWFNHLSILGPRGQKLYLSERIARELQKYSIIKRRLGKNK